MEIKLFSKCIKELIVENDRVDVPYLGVFTAEMMPASYSDRQTTIHPPYRKMAFHKAEVSLADGRLLLDKVRRELGVTLNQAGVELGWCLSRLCSELEGHKICKLPGLGVMRANARNEFFFVPDDDLDIWPDGMGFEPISIKISEKTAVGLGQEIPVPAVNDEKPARNDEEAQVETAEEQAEHVDAQPAEEVKEVERVSPVAKQPSAPVYHAKGRKRRRPLRPIGIVLIVLGALLVLFIAASYLFTEQMSPILDPLLYSKEELELLRGL